MSSPTPSKKEPKELSNEVRMLLAFVLMGLILVVTPYAYRKLGLVPPEAPKKAVTAKEAAAPPSSTSDYGERSSDEPIDAPSR